MANVWVRELRNKDTIFCACCNHAASTGMWKSMCKDVICFQQLLWTFQCCCCSQHLSPCKSAHWTKTFWQLSITSWKNADLGFCFCALCKFAFGWQQSLCFVNRKLLHFCGWSLFKNTVKSTFPHICSLLRHFLCDKDRFDFLLRVSQCQFVNNVNLDQSWHAWSCSVSCCCWAPSTFF